MDGSTPMGVVSPVRLDGLGLTAQPVDGQMDAVAAGVSRHEPDASGEARDTDESSTCGDPQLRG